MMAIPPFYAGQTSAVKPASDNIFFTRETASSSLLSTVIIRSGLFKSTLQLSISAAESNCSLTLATQLLHFKLVFNLKVFILLSDYLFYITNVKKTEGLHPSGQIFFAFIRRLLVTTETELNAMAAAAIIGFNKKPQQG